MQAFCKVFSFLYYCFNISKITFARHAERIYILSVSNPCATFALQVHIFFCSKWHIDSTKKRLFASGTKKAVIPLIEITA